MFILRDNTTFIVGLAGTSDLTAGMDNWCSKYQQSNFTCMSGVTLPAGYLPNCWVYSMGSWSILSGKEALVAAQIARGATVPALSSGDVAEGVRTLSDGVTQVSLDITIHPVAQANSYEIKCTGAGETTSRYVTTMEPGVLNLTGLAASKAYSVALRVSGLWGRSEWTPGVSITTSGALDTSLLSELTDDNKFTAVEKSQFKPQYESMIDEQAGIDAAVSVLISDGDGLDALKTAYDSAVSAMQTYVETTVNMFGDMHATSAISGATLNTKIKGVLAAKQALFNGMAVYTGAAGVDAVVVTLSNESSIIATDYYGADGDFSKAGVDIRMYEGVTQLTYDGVGTTAGTWAVEVIEESGILSGGVSAVNGISGRVFDSGVFVNGVFYDGIGGVFARVAPPMNMSYDAAYIQYHIYGKNSSGSDFSIVKTQTFSKSKAAPNYTVTVESTNGDIFRIGQAISTMLKAHVFLNGQEVTDNVPDSQFQWRRVSYLSNPVGDAAWNAAYSTGYKQIDITIDSVDSIATFHCGINQ